jgi:predicted membrane protein
METYNKDENVMKKHQQYRNPAKTMVIGLMVVAFGLLYMLRNMQVIDQQTWRVIFSWPMLLVAIGIINLAERKISWGLLFLAIGGAFLIDRYYDLSFNLFTFFWPVMIIVIGIFLIFSNASCPLINRFRRNKTRVSGSDGDVIEEAAVFGGSERIIHSNNFKGGEIVAVFGGSKLDLTQCQLAPGENKLELVAVFGGTTLIVPNDWNVKMEIVNVFGGFADKRHNLNVDYNKTLIIEGVAIFGGGELKSY